MIKATDFQEVAKSLASDFGLDSDVHQSPHEPFSLEVFFHRKIKVDILQAREDKNYVFDKIAKFLDDIPRVFHLKSDLELEVEKVQKLKEEIEGFKTKIGVLKNQVRVAGHLLGNDPVAALNAAGEE